MVLTPENDQQKEKDWVNLGLGIFVLIFSFVVYWATVHRTLSFWDCGEFIACSYILGIPHPPGTPLYVLIGRLFSIFPMAADIGFRVNMFSVITTAFASMFGYFIVVRLVRDWFATSWNNMQRLGAYAGGLIGGLLMAFSLTNWNSAVEAEVYGPSMLLIAVIFWLALVWAEKRHQSGSDKYLILIAYLATLSFAFHQTVYLIMPMVLLLVVLVDERLRRDPRFWITSFVLLIFIYSLSWYMIFTLAWLLISAIAYMVSRDRRWALSLFMMLAVVVGFSVQTYTPIRAGLKPAINENAPDNWAQFKNFLERKQYGQQSMVTRMFLRRGTWGNQFGDHPRMGFLGFFWEQYGVTGKLFLFTLFPLGLIGMLELMHRRWKKGIPFFLMVLAATVGLVLYMNFADGTMQGKLGADDAHLEVRDRDYFWQPGFILFALAIGIGFAAVWDMVYSALRSRRELSMITIMLLIFVLYLPVRALQVNYSQADRSNNFIPYDYAYNLLISADSNAVVFTNGDNDTFPVWCLQEVYGIRKDVRIANLSLLNTNWYIKQLKNQMGVPISYTDGQVDALRHTRTPDGRFKRIQDIMIDNIIETNRWKEPIHFAVTVSEDNRRYKGNPLEDHLEMCGMMYRLKKESGKDMIDIENTKRLYLDAFRYRGIADTNVFKNENTARLTNNYSAGFLFCADRIRRSGDNEGSIRMVQKSMEILPLQWQNYAYLAQIYSEMDSLERIEELLKEAPEVVDLTQIWTTMAHSYWSKNQQAKAYSLLNEQLEREPENKTLHTQLLNYFYRDKRFDSLEQLLERWSIAHPADTEAQEALAEVRLLIAKDTTPAGVRVKQVDTIRSPAADNPSTDSE